VSVCVGRLAPEPIDGAAIEGAGDPPSDPDAGGAVDWDGDALPVLGDADDPDPGGEAEARPSSQPTASKARTAISVAIMRRRLATRPSRERLINTSES
jgi:hypothetical protein